MEFQCKYSELKGNYVCQVVNIVKTSSFSRINIFTGEHFEGKTNDDVKLLSIENKPLEAFPRNLYEKFPNLTWLWINRCGLTKISRTDLIGLKNLEELIAKENELKSLPDNLFAGMRRLKHINFDRNKLERLSSNLLKTIETSLERAYFFENTKINDYFVKNDRTQILKRLMQIMDSLEPPLPKTDSHPKSLRKASGRNEHQQQVFAKFAEFRVSGKFTDFTIKVRREEFKVHKSFLAAQSPVFLQTFTNDDGTAEKTFTKVKNFSEDSFGHFLDFFYTGRVDEESNALEVFELAMVYEVAALIKICADKISATLSQSNALEVFNIAHHHNCDRLKQAAFKVIQKMLPEIPDNLVENENQVNRLVAAKREFDAILNEATANKK